MAETGHRPGAVTEGRATEAECVHVVTQAGQLALDDLIALGGAGAPVMITEGLLSAVTSPVAPATFEGLDREEVETGGRLEVLAQRHDDIVFGVAQQRSVLPMRFGTLLPGVRAVQQILRSQAAAFANTLEAITDRWEWTYRLSWSREAVARSLGVPRQSEDESAGAGTRYLRDRSRQVQLGGAIDEVIGRTAASVGEALTRVAEAVAPIQDARGLAAALLVHQDSAAALTASARDCSRDLEHSGFELSLRGPMPPYHFVQPALVAVAT